MVATFKAIAVPMMSPACEEMIGIVVATNIAMFVQIVRDTYQGLDGFMVPPPNSEEANEEHNCCAAEDTNFKRESWPGTIDT